MLLTRQIPWQDPVAAFSVFAEDPVAALLHGNDESNGDGERSRWSYIAASPFCTVSVDHDFSTNIDDKYVSDMPFDALKALLARYQNETRDTPAPFQGGAVGFFSYELGGVVEQLPSPKPDSTSPLLSVGLYDVIMAFDHHSRRAWILSNGFPEQEEQARKARAKERMAWMAQSISQEPRAPIDEAISSWTSTQSQECAEHAIGKTIEYIRAGDIFQANITQRFVAPRPQTTSPWDLFQRLRKVLPSPFGAYLSANKNNQVLSASPERFLRVDADGCVETRPIKGTRPRGRDDAEDTTLAKDLLSSPKDKAENLMIVDLMRNDLSRACETGSINVPQCNEVETFTQVHHLVSVVTGQLESGNSAIDLLRACFPGGSVTGAPKIRAMEIIHELEPVSRGPYCGAIAWIGFDGAMDSSIVIRSLVVEGDRVIAQAGGGIVADSDPALEYEEAMVKIRPLLSVLDPAI